MALRDLFAAKNGEPRLHRRRWTESDDPLVNEARQQTLALQRLQVWLRLAYAALALGVLMGYWGFAEDGGLVPAVGGALIAALSLVVVIVLRVGIGNGRKNVNAMLSVLEGRSANSSSGALE